MSWQGVSQLPTGRKIMSLATRFTGAHRTSYKVLARCFPAAYRTSYQVLARCFPVAHRTSHNLLGRAFHSCLQNVMSGPGQVVPSCPYQDIIMASSLKIPSFLVFSRGHNFSFGDSFNLSARLLLERHLAPVIFNTQRALAGKRLSSKK